MRLLVFLQGTALMHPGAVGRTREERIAQVRAAQDPTLHDYDAYVPVGNVVAKLRRWQQQGAQIDYLSAHRNPEDVAKDAAVLRRYGFPPGRVLARLPGQSYGQVAARELPTILIEDDCQSIGADQITYPQIPADLRGRIKSIIVPEFGGLDHLPDSLQDLLAFNPKARPDQQPVGHYRGQRQPGRPTGSAPAVPFATPGVDGLAGEAELAGDLGLADPAANSSAARSLRASSC